VDTFFIYLTIFGVLFSSIINFIAARSTRGWLHRMFIITGVLSLFYIPAYALALTSFTSYAVWSSFMLGFSWVVWWGAPWSGFALLNLYQDKLMKKNLKQNSSIMIYDDGSMNITVGKDKHHSVISTTITDDHLMEKMSDHL
jgi:hypothetical protein